MAHKNNLTGTHIDQICPLCGGKFEAWISIKSEPLQNKIDFSKPEEERNATETVAPVSDVAPIIPVDQPVDVSTKSRQKGVKHPGKSLIKLLKFEDAESVSPAVFVFPKQGYAFYKALHVAAKDYTNRNRDFKAYSFLAYCQAMYTKVDFAKNTRKR